ncbi:VOC family protein [Bacillus sp. FJAT-45037]|uniref:VOC family protein n=1 Tax=Bacillus sp. FJAT-45037 TaxID=2011007 RepID=UPI000C235A4F|nr:VOC family protein [Bacillus sp. FJAT-45037]
MIIGLHHAQITIPQGKEEAGRDFYCRVLSLEEVEKPNALKGRGGFWLRVGNFEVHVGTEEGFDRFVTKAHLAYEVEDINYWREVLEHEGIDLVDSVPIPGHERFEFRDPFGNRVEMIARA